MQPTWTHEAESWIDEQLARLGWTRTGPLDVVRDSPRGRVVTLPTTAGTLYAKRPAAFLAPEGAILSRLASPARLVPEVLAVDAASGWWLGPGFERESPVHDDAGLALALGSLAEVQLRAVDQVGHLLAAGCPDYRLERLPAAFHALLSDPEIVALLAPPEADRVGELESRHERCCLQVADVLPATVGHGDLTPWNLAQTPAGIVLFDWANGFVGAPFVDCLTLLGARQSGPRWQRLSSAYADRWFAARPAAVDRGWLWQRIGALWGATHALIADRHRRALTAEAREAAARDVQRVVRVCGQRLGVFPQQRERRPTG